jgi:hypothetical protein
MFPLYSLLPTATASKMRFTYNTEKIANGGEKRGKYVVLRDPNLARTAG